MYSLSCALKFEGHETLSATSVAEAEKLFAGIEQRDIVIADYHLDSKNTGLDMLLRLRARVGRDVPGIVLSGDLPTVLRSIKSPIANCRFLSKPVDIAALVESDCRAERPIRESGPRRRLARQSANVPGRGWPG